MLHILVWIQRYFDFSDVMSDEININMNELDSLVYLVKSYFFQNYLKGENA